MHISYNARTNNSYMPELFYGLKTSLICSQIHIEYAIFKSLIYIYFFTDDAHLYQLKICQNT